MLGLAIAITAEAFKDMNDKGGKPYMLHCIEVMNGVKYLGENAMCIAVMHDLVEDTDWTIEKITALGFNSFITHGLHLITHWEGVSYEDYIKIVATDKIATAIKLADLRHNLDPTRLKGIRKKDFDRVEKYHKAYLYLQN